MSFVLPPLPYSMDAFTGFLSKETFEYHYGKHHQTYVTKLNEFTSNTPYESLSLEEVIIKSREKKDIKVFNNAAQTFNHTFYWNSLSPRSSIPSSGGFVDAVKKSFGSFEEFENQFTTQAAGVFGSGWLWLVKDASGSISLLPTSNAECPLGSDKTALLTCDVWEHAYYIDYRNKRPDYLAQLWKHTNWEFAQKNWEARK